MVQQITWRTVNQPNESMAGYESANSDLFTAASLFRNLGKDAFKLRDMESQFIQNQAAADVLSGRLSPYQIQNRRVDPGLLEDLFMGQKKNKSILETDRLTQLGLGYENRINEFASRPGNLQTMFDLGVDEKKGIIAENVGDLALSQERINASQEERERLRKAAAVAEQQRAGVIALEKMFGDQVVSGRNAELNARLPEILQNMSAEYHSTLDNMLQNDSTPAEIHAYKTAFQNDLANFTSNVAPADATSLALGQAQQNFALNGPALIARMGLTQADVAGAAPVIQDAAIRNAALEQQKLETAASRAQNQAKLNNITNARAGKDFSGLFFGGGRVDAFTDTASAAGNKISSTQIRTAIRERFDEDISVDDANAIHDAVKGNLSAFEAIFSRESDTGESAYEDGNFGFGGFNLNATKRIANDIGGIMANYAADPKNTDVVSTGSVNSLLTGGVRTARDAGNAAFPRKRTPEEEEEEAAATAEKAVVVNAKNLKSEADTALSQLDELSATALPGQVDTIKQLKRSLDFVRKGRPAISTPYAVSQIPAATMDDRIQEMQRIQAAIKQLETAVKNKALRARQEDALNKAFEG